MSTNATPTMDLNAHAVYCRMPAFVERHPEGGARGVRRRLAAINQLDDDMTR